MMKRARCLFAVVLCLSGCYSDRWTSRYDTISDTEIYEDGASAILGESDMDDAAKSAQIAELEALEREETQLYRINAGDRIEVRVYGHDDLSVITKVSPDGSVGMVFLGQVVISGMTIKEACDAIEKGLAPYVKHPVVGVTVLEVASEAVTMAGSCRNPGIYVISSSTRLADAYAQAGGSAARLFNGADVDIADLEHSLIVRDGRVLPVDFKLAVNGDKLHNVRLRKGDYIFIAQRMESSVTICGEVRNPHRRIYESGMGLVETLTTAGWMLESHWSHVILIRNGIVNPKMYKIDIDGILSGKCKNVLLKPNDIVYVPKDNAAEYNVFVRKLIPTAQLISLLTSRISMVTSN